MIFCYAGLSMFTLCFCVTFWQMFRQWFKAEKFQAEIVSGDHSHGVGNVEENCRAYAFACLIASGIFAALNVVIGGIVWAAGG